MALTDWDDLDQFLGDVPEEDYERPAELDSAKANRMMRKMRRLQQWRADTIATADAEIARITQWRDGRDQMISGEIGRLEAALEAYMRTLNLHDPKLKTQNLPNGVLRLRAPRTRVVVTEPSIAVNYLLHRVAEGAGDDTDLDFAHIDAVLDALNAEPMLNVKVSVAGGEIGKHAEKGEPRGVEYPGGISTAPPANIYAAMLDNGEALPGVTLHVSVDDSFTYTVADDTPQPYGDDQPNEDEL